MSEPVDYAAHCVKCTWACSTIGTDHGLEKVKTLAFSHHHSCEPTDCILIKQRNWNDGAEEYVWEVIDQINNDTVRSISNGVSV